MSTLDPSEIRTAEQLFLLPDDFGRCELVRGELLLMNPTGSFHGGIENTIASRITAHVREKRLGKVFSAETVRCPDVSFVQTARVPAEPPAGFFPGPPDLAVEIRHPAIRFLTF